MIITVYIKPIKEDLEFLLNDNPIQSIEDIARNESLIKARLFSDKEQGYITQLQINLSEGKYRIDMTESDKGIVYVGKIRDRNLNLNRRLESNKSVLREHMNMQRNRETHITGTIQDNKDIIKQSKEQISQILMRMKELEGNNTPLFIRKEVK